MQSYFDPKTGELIGGEIGASTQPYQQNNQANYQQNYQQNNQMNYQQNYQQSYQQNYQQNYQQPQQQNQPSNGDGNGKKIILGVGIGCGALVVVGVLIFVISQFLISDPIVKIGKAAMNTFKMGQIQEVLNPVGIIDQDKMSFDVLLEGGGDKIGVSGAYQQSKQKKALNAKVDVEIYGEELALEGTVELDENRLAISVPEFNDMIYSYYYTQDNDGYLVDELDDEDLEMINEYLTTLYELGNDDSSEEFTKAIVEIFSNELKALEIEELDKEEFEINDKDVMCGGYLLTITEDNAMNVIDQLADVYEEYYADSLGEMLEEMYVDPDDYFEELEYTFEDMPDIELSFYIYKNQFACIKMEVDGEDGACCLNFHGGEYPAQNMEMIIEDGRDEYTIFETEGSVKNHVESTIIIVEDEEICEINYNQKTGELEVVGGEYLDFDLSAVLTRKGNTLTLELDELEIGGGGPSGMITLSGDANVEELKGEEFDLGNASEDDFEDLGEELMEFVEDKGLY